MSAKVTYTQRLEQAFGGLIEATDLSEMRKQFLRSRWLEQTLWMEGRANQARSRYYTLRLSTLIGGVIIPALVSLSLEGPVAVWVRWLVFAISLVVAISSAIEGFFRYGERWRRYRQTVEALKSEGWEFFQLAGRYSRYQSHAEAYPRFAGWAEEVIRRDVQLYISEVVREKEEKQQQQATDDDG